MRQAIVATIFRTLLLAAAFAGATGLADEANPGRPLFADNSVIELELSGPFDTLFDDTDERRRQPMVLRVGDRQLAVEVRIRGKSRVQVCDFPPLRVYFGKDTAGTPFAGQKSLKLVTHCFNNDRGERNLVDEYAAYRTLAALTDASYRTRPVRIRYEDSQGKLPDDASPRAAFFIERRTDLAKRIGAEKADIEALRLSELDQLHAATVFVFQYLIANTDWSLVAALETNECCHNVDLVRHEDKLLIIPYDFDLAGIVNAPYAKPDPDLRLRRVTTRRYRGYCIDESAVQRALRYVRDQRNEIEAELRTIPIAMEGQVEDILDFFEPFFRQAADEDKLLKRFRNRCL